ncbi:MAG: hypothetical protein ACI92I_000600 [Acidimicrobiales bacterium]|jgi:hypothetical protein
MSDDTTEVTSSIPTGARTALIIAGAVISLSIIFAILNTIFKEPTVATSSESSSLGWLFYLSFFIFAVLVCAGTLQHWKTGDAVATKHLATAVAAVFVVIAVSTILFGKSSVERFLGDAREMGDTFATRKVNPTPQVPAQPRAVTVSDTTYMEKATGGTYTLTKNERLSFDWGSGKCLKAFPPEGVEWTPFARNHRGAFRSFGANRIVEIKELNPGETWHGYTCPTS